MGYAGIIERGTRMRYSKTVAGVAICAASVMGVSAGSVFAGEVNGNGGPTGIWGNANSPCAFSGLEDNNPGTGEVDPSSGETQNWGHTRGHIDGAKGANGPIDGPEGETGCNANDYGLKP
jgi:hypothetical protein